MKTSFILTLVSATIVCLGCGGSAETADESSGDKLRQMESKIELARAELAKAKAELEAAEAKAEAANLKAEAAELRATMRDAKSKSSEISQDNLVETDSLRELKNEVRQLLESYLNALGVRKRLPYVINPKLVAPYMYGFYGEQFEVLSELGMAYSVKNISFMSPGGQKESSKFEVIVEIEMAIETESEAVTHEKQWTICSTKNGLKIDWYTSLQPELLEADTVIWNTTDEEIEAMTNPSLEDHSVSIGLRRIGLAIHNYHSAYKKLPSQALLNDARAPLLSWRVLILPFLGYQDLYESFKLDEPWDSEHNLPLLKQMPWEYQTSEQLCQIKDTSDSKTCMLLPLNRHFIYQDRVSPHHGERQLSDVLDGLANTLLVVEATEKNSVPWTKPRDLPISREAMLADLAGSPDQMFSVLLADGSVEMIIDQIEQGLLWALFTRCGKEGIPKIEGWELERDCEVLDLINGIANTFPKDFGGVCIENGEANLLGQEILDLAAVEKSEFQKQEDFDQWSERAFCSAFIQGKDPYHVYTWAEDTPNFDAEKEVFPYYISMPYSFASIRGEINLRYRDSEGDVRPLPRFDDFELNCGLSNAKSISKQVRLRGALVYKFLPQSLDSTKDEEVNVLIDKDTIYHYLYDERSGEIYRSSILDVEKRDWIDKMK